MKRILEIASPYISIMSLAVIIFTSILVYKGSLEKNTYIVWTNIATAVWFVISPWWLISRKKQVQ